MFASISHLSSSYPRIVILKHWDYSKISIQQHCLAIYYDTLHSTSQFFLNPQIGLTTIWVTFLFFCTRKKFGWCTMGMRQSFLCHTLSIFSSHYNDASSLLFLFLFLFAIAFFLLRWLLHLAWFLLAFQPPPSASAPSKNTWIMASINV